MSSAQNQLLQKPLTAGSLNSSCTGVFESASDTSSSSDEVGDSEDESSSSVGSSGNIPWIVGDSGVNRTGGLCAARSRSSSAKAKMSSCKSGIEDESRDGQVVSRGLSSLVSLDNFVSERIPQQEKKGCQLEVYFFCQIQQGFTVEIVLRNKQRERRYIL